MTESLWKFAAVFFSGLVATGIGVHFTLVREMVTKKEVAAIVRDSAPYIRDKSQIETRIVSLETANKEFYRLMLDIRDRLARIEVGVGVKPNGGKNGNN